MAINTVVAECKGSSPVSIPVSPDKDRTHGLLLSVIWQMVFYS